MKTTILYRTGFCILLKWLIAVTIISSTFQASGQIFFGPEVIIDTDADNPRWVDVIDIDGDGDKDVVAVSQNDDRIAWHENDGAQNFTQHDISLTFDRANGVACGDFDGDGDVDIAASSFTNLFGRISWFRNDGAQNFTQIDIETNLDQVHGVVANDIDMDGDLDILVTVRDEDRVVLYTNNGSASFTASNVASGSAVCNNPRTVWVEDIDGDGDKDVLHQAMLGNAVYWNENDGAQNFTTHLVNAGSLGDVKFVSAGDIDDDGDMDIISASPGTDDVVFHINDGNQNFTHTIFSSANLNPFCARPVDLDFDGDLDLIVASKGQNHFAWYENLGAGTFGPKNIISGVSTCAGAIYVVPDDLDGDGDIDAIVAATDDDDVSWFDPVVPLPVEGLEFYGKKQNGEIQLFWTTTMEIDNDYFEVQKSLDGINYEVIATIEGAGNTQQAQYYESLDRQPTKGWNYYRLRQIDFNGQFQYSNVIAFDYQQLFTDAIRVSPNPAQTLVNLSFSAEEPGPYVISICNEIGNSVLIRTELVKRGRNVIELDIQHLAAGVYTVLVRASDSTQKQARLIKK